MWNRKFGRKADHRKAMLRNLATSVILYGRVETTEAKAKDLRSVVDEMITLGKKGDLASRRRAAAFIRNVVADEKTEQTVLQTFISSISIFPVSLIHLDKRGAIKRPAFCISFQ